MSDKALLFARVQSGISQASKGNALLNLPYAPVPSWSTQTAYMQGDVVRGLGVDASHQYIAWDATGKSALDGPGPQGMKSSAITDGGVTWYYAGEVRSIQVDSAAPQVSWGLRTDMLKNMPSYQTLVPSVLAPLAFYSGGLVESDPSMPNRSVVTVRGSNLGAQGSPVFLYPSTASMTFWTDSDQIVLGSYNAVYEKQRMVLEVNDRRLNDSQVAVTPGSKFFNPGGFLIDFRDSTLKSKSKKIRVLTTDGFAVTAAQVYIENGKKLWTENNSNHWKLAVEGDSLTQGGYQSPYQPGQDWVSQVGALLGCDDVANMAQGGTGFISDNKGKKTTYMQRIERFASLNADVYVIAGNHNDLSYPAADQIQAALRYFKKLRELQPKAVIVVFGVNPLQGESSDSGGVRNAELNLKVAFDQWADDNAYFVPIATDPNGPWITGTGSVDAPKGDGNKDLFYTSKDGHPLQRGVDFFAQRYAQALKNIFAGK
jgi:lysophospholipase L1-like esterase